MKAALALVAVITLGLLVLFALLQAVRALLSLGAARPLDAAYDGERTRLRDERDRLLNHLREVRFDHATGKLDGADHDRLSARYAAEAAAVLDALDAAEAAESRTGAAA